MVMLDHIALKLLLNVYFTIHILQTAQMMKSKQCLTNTIKNALYRYSGLDTFYKLKSYASHIKFSTSYEVSPDWLIPIWNSISF